MSHINIFSIAKHRCNYAMLIIGTFLTLLGIAAVFFLETLVHAVIADSLALKRDSYAFKLWAHPPADIYFEVYLMNVTNPERAALGLEKPNLVNQGPYVFYELRRKFNVTFYDNGTLSFYEPIFYFWKEDMSRGNKLTDKITQLDLIVAGMSQQFSSCTSKSNSTVGCVKPFLMKSVLPSVAGFDIADELFNVQHRSIFKTYTVNDLLFNGYIDPFLVKFKKIAKMSGQQVPARLGLFWGRNGSACGVYTLETGELDMKRYQAVTNFRGRSSQNVWTTPYANRIEGTLGHAYRPFLTETDSIGTFAGDLCRSANMYYKKTTNINGLRAFVFSPAQGGKSFPGDKTQEGYCYPDTDHCPPDGIMDLTPCFNEPMYMGKPHFFDSDPLLGTVFTGLSPNEEEHETEMRVDPYTGSILTADSRLMAYFPVRKSFITEAGNIHLTPNVRDGITTLFPMFWVNETAKVRKSVINQIRFMVYPAIAFANVTPYVLLVVGLSLVVAAIIRFVNYDKKQRGNENIRRSNKCTTPKISSDHGKQVNNRCGETTADSNNKNNDFEGEIVNPLLKKPSNSNFIPVDVLAK